MNDDGETGDTVRVFASIPCSLSFNAFHRECTLRYADQPIRRAGLLQYPSALVYLPRSPFDILHTTAVVGEGQAAVFPICFTWA